MDYMGVMAQVVMADIELKELSSITDTYKQEYPDWAGHIEENEWSAVDKMDVCDNCTKRGQCPVNCEEQNVIMGKACQALRKHFE